MIASSLDARASTVDPTEAGKRLGLSPRTLANLRSRQMGPPYLRVMGKIRYRIHDLAGWLDKRVLVPGSQPVIAPSPSVAGLECSD